IELFADAHIRSVDMPKSKIDLDVEKPEHTVESFTVEVGKTPLSQLFNILEKNPVWQFKAKDIVAVAHRIVHGGEQTKSQRLTPQLIEDIESLSALAPLHNPASIAGINAAMAQVDKNIPHFAVFDTAFHHNLPAKASTYGIPANLAEKFLIKRYGFHGIAHQSLWKIYENLRKQKNDKDRKVITLQLGNGCSMAAISEGRSLDTTMGFTPGEGLLMGTRAGDLDTGVVGFLCKHTGESVDQINRMLNSESGLLGVSGVASDMKTLSSHMDQPRVQLAVDLFCYRIIKYIGSYAAVLGGVDALIFSGGIGENSPYIRKEIAKKMSWIGLKIDEELNERVSNLQPAEVHKISVADSSFEVYVIGSNENAFIAQEVVNMFEAEA
nr:acetate/propionate family kinase [Parachlamydiaceae bacterium]